MHAVLTGEQPLVGALVRTVHIFNKVRQAWKATGRTIPSRFAPLLVDSVDDELGDNASHVCKCLEAPKVKKAVRRSRSSQATNVEDQEVKDLQAEIRKIRGQLTRLRKKARTAKIARKAEKQALGQAERLQQESLQAQRREEEEA